MTTNVYDGALGIAGTDSRWSVERDYAIFYVDDTGFEKIFVRDDAVFLFAGNSHVIQEWKNYLAGQRYSHVTTEPPLEGIALLIVNSVSKEIIYGYGQDITIPGNGMLPVASFAGSGGRCAASCWIRNRCAKRAIDTAKQLDLFSGGETKFFELTSNACNLSEDVGLQGLREAFKERGMVMFLAQQDKPMSIQDAQAIDPRVAEFAQQVASGQAQLSAPCDAMYNIPSEEDKAELRKVLGTLFGN